MRSINTVICFLLVNASILCLLSCSQKSEDKKELKLSGWDLTWMQQVKSSLQKGDNRYKPAFDQVVKEANEALEAGVYSVTYKKMLPPSGSKHDYMSMGPYWWPDPDKPDGLPYIRKDGEVNPERDATDSPQLGKLSNSLRSLALAWYFSDNIAYAQKAAELLRVWFLNEETLMNPHLEFSQAIPGRTPGRFIGVIDGSALGRMADPILLLENSGAMTLEEQAGIRSWFTRYFRWLTESEHGKNEDAYHNNHSVAYDVQSASIAFLIGDTDFAARKVRELPGRRIDLMIEEDGSQPGELIRTRAFSYSVGNLGNFFNVAQIGLPLDVNVFAYKNVKGGSLQKGLDFLTGYIGKESEWPHQQISKWSDVENNLGLLVRRAGYIYKNPDYQKLWDDTFYEREQNNWNLLVYPELL
ncbi:MAG: alginate lyase family protein [Cyclobacteriaceae bacterium]|nr:alginate lyase family protein [Cyclobacteriaceae bacterium]